MKYFYKITVPTQINLETSRSVVGHPRSIRVKYINNVMHFFDRVNLILPGGAVYYEGITTQLKVG